MYFSFYLARGRDVHEGDRDGVAVAVAMAAVVAVAAAVTRAEEFHGLDAAVSGTEKKIRISV